MQPMTPTVQVESVELEAGHHAADRGLLPITIPRITRHHHDLPSRRMEQEQFVRLGAKLTGTLEGKDDSHRR